jgi:hypothetical protein
MTDVFCECEAWKTYEQNYKEVFTWFPEYQRWYILWVKLSENEGITQISRYAIPISFCPVCGGKLKTPEDG